MPTSSANPYRLRRYANDSLALSDALVRGADRVNDALGALSGGRGGSPYVPAVGTAGPDYADLAGDWRHLDEFVGDVADGFYRFVGTSSWSEGAVPLDNVVLSLDDGVLAREGRVGYADRDEAIAQAEAMAAELERLRGNGGATIDEVLALVDMAERGQYDPAFSVAFTEAVGVEGYNEATAMIRRAYETDLDRLGMPVPPEGLAAVGVLAQTMTTALDTLPGIPARDRHDPDNAVLPDDQRLARGFVTDLTTGYQPSVGAEDPFHNPEDLYGANAIDLSVLLGMTDPPTTVAVEIANNRMTPMLSWGNGLNEHALPPPVAHPWGEHSGIVTNYADMLGRNQDASAQWLASDDGVNLEGEPTGQQNIGLVLQRDDSLDLDGGENLAEVVENGLTHPDMVPTRHALMHEAIDVIGRQEEVRNDHMYAALASGVEANMDVVSDHILANWDEHSRDRGVAPPPEARHAYEFFEAVMVDGDAAARVNAAADDYALGQLSAAPDDGDHRTRALEDVGAVHGIISQAEMNVLVGSTEGQISEQERRAALLDYVVGQVPGVGVVNDTGDLAGRSVGSFAFPADYHELEVSEQEAVALDVKTDVDMAVLLAMADHPDRGTVPLDDLSPSEREAFVDWATSDDVYDDNDHNSLTAGSERATRWFQFERSS